MSDIRLNTTLRDGTNQVSLVEGVSVTRPVGLGSMHTNVTLRGIEAGPGLKIELLDADNAAKTEGRKIRISATGSGGSGGGPVAYSDITDQPLTYSTVNGQPALALTRNLDTNGFAVVNGMGAGAVSINGVSYEKKVSYPLEDNKSAPTSVYTVPYTGKVTAYIDYVVDRGAAGMRSGTLYAVSNGFQCSLSDVGVENQNTAVGVEFTATMQNGAIRINYTSTATGQAGQVMFAPRILR